MDLSANTDVISENTIVHTLEEAGQLPDKPMSKQMRYYYRHHQKFIDKYKNDPEVIRKQEIRKQKRLQKAQDGVLKKEQRELKRKKILIELQN